MRLLAQERQSLFQKRREQNVRFPAIFSLFYKGKNCRKSATLVVDSAALAGVAKGRTHRT
jgi:hypothetical protein